MNYKKFMSKRLDKKNDLGELNFLRKKIADDISVKDLVEAKKNGERIIPLNITIIFSNGYKVVVKRSNNEWLYEVTTFYYEKRVTSNLVEKKHIHRNVKKIMKLKRAPALNIDNNEIDDDYFINFDLSEIDFGDNEFDFGI